MCDILEASLNGADVVFFLFLLSGAWYHDMWLEASPAIGDNANQESNIRVAEE